jgi:hypothetical protein
MPASIPPHAARHTLQKARSVNPTSYPPADGAFAADLVAGNDFAVMERGICTGLRGTKWCGGPKTGAY